MEIYYLHNSGFAVFLEKSLLIFDYYKTVTESKEKNVSGGILSKEDLCRKENICVFASHSHPDHFNPAIFKWQEDRPDIRYFLDKDIKPFGKKPNHAVFMQKGDIVEEGGLTVKAFGSTDTGSSFYVEAGGFKIFHAGDLNYWHWRDSSTAAYVEEAKRAFDMEMSLIEQSVDYLDLAFFPVDPMMGEGYDEGAVYFIESLKPVHFIPMHCRGDLKVLEDFRQKKLYSGSVIHTYRERGEKITI